MTTDGALWSQADREFMATRERGGYGTGEGTFGLVLNHVEGSSGIAYCGMCTAEAVLYFVDSANARQRFACLTHTGAIAFDVAIVSTVDHGIPAAERGPDDRRLPSRQHLGAAGQPDA